MCYDIKFETLSLFFFSSFVETPPPGYMSEDGENNEQSMDTSQSGSKCDISGLMFLIKLANV